MAKHANRDHSLRDYLDEKAPCSRRDKDAVRAGKSHRQQEDIHFTGGKRAYIYDPQISFDKWLGLYAEDIKAHTDPMVPGLGILKHLFRGDDLKNFLKIAGRKTLPQDRPEKPRLRLSDGRFLSINDDVKQRLVAVFQDLGVLGESADMVALYGQVAHLCEGIKRYPQSLPNIHIKGEPGSGKELVAQAIHRLSGRGKPFEVINCAAIPDNLLESELFGHVKGAFTDAKEDKEGILVECAKGTVQLDEIHKMPPHQLPKLLRVLQERKARQVGGSKDFDLDVLFISSCNVDLAEKVKRDDFPRDLYERLAGEVITVPSLHDRVDDIPLLVNHFLEEDYPNSNLDLYRFPFVYWCMEQVAEPSRRRGDGKAISVRGLRNLVGQMVRHFLPIPVSAGEDKRQRAVREAIELLQKEGGKPPFPKAKVAREIEWKERKGIARSTLNSEAWRDSLLPFVQARLIRH